MKKFDFAIGNPPYQDETIGDNESYAPPVYDKFIDSASEIADKVELIHPARFLFNAGGTPKSWNEKMLNDEHFKVLQYEQDSAKLFSNTTVMGGVAVTYYDNSKTFKPIKVFTSFKELNTIMQKVYSNKPISINTLFYLQNKFNLETLYDDYPEYRNIIGSDGNDKRFRNNIFEKIPLFTDDKSDNECIEVYGVLKNVRCKKYFPLRYLDLNNTNLYKWKVLLPSNNGSPALGDKETALIGNPFVVSPGVGYTQTFLSIGAVDFESEATAIYKYVCSKFARCLLGILKATPNNPPEKWKYVPLQDFTNNSDIDWSKSIKEIDQQLYKKYNLSDDEIKFIETHVKEMK